MDTEEMVEVMGGKVFRLHSDRGIARGVQREVWYIGDVVEIARLAGRLVDCGQGGTWPSRGRVRVIVDVKIDLETGFGRRFGELTAKCSKRFVNLRTKAS